jgi:glutathione S-transferase
MKLYYMVGACSLASFISLTEAGVKFEHSALDRQTRKTAEGEDYDAINPKGYVPALKLDSGELLTENVAVLSYIGDLNPAAKLIPAAGTKERQKVLEWLAYVNGEVHKNFSVLFNPAWPEGSKAVVFVNLDKRLGYIESTLGDKKYLTGDDFTVADAYLYVVLSWRSRVGVDIGKFPKLTALWNRIADRPGVQAARVAEGLPAK